MEEGSGKSFGDIERFCYGMPDFFMPFRHDCCLPLEPGEGISLG
jgi:hypothetical protein